MGDARAGEREPLWGTLLVAGEEAPVLYVAARTVTRVHFEELVEVHALPGLETRGRVEVTPFGERALAVSPVRDLAEGERLELAVGGRTEAGEAVRVKLALVTRKEVVDEEAWVSLGRVSSSGLLASHELGGHPGLALSMPKGERVFEYAGKNRAWVESVLQVDGRLFTTVVFQADWHQSKPWRLSRARLEVGCHPGRGQPMRLSSTMFGQYQIHTFSAPLPEGAGCVALTMEEDGPRMLRFKELKVSP